MPVGFDRDGAVGALYRVGGCPTFAYRLPRRDPAGAPASATSTAGSSRIEVDDLLRATAAAAAGRELTDSAEAAGGDVGWEPAPEQGWVAPHLAAEFPGLGIAWITVDSRLRAQPRAGQATGSRPLRPLLRVARDPPRERPIPWAYRVFFRQIGLDPDRTRTPVEQLALERLQDGAVQGPRPARRRAHDRDGRDRGGAARLRRRAGRGALCASTTRAPGEALRGEPVELPQGTLVIADERGPIGTLFGERRSGCGVEQRHPPGHRRRGPGRRGAPDLGRRGALDGAGGARGFLTTSTRIGSPVCVIYTRSRVYAESSRQSHTRSIRHAR